MQKSSVVGFYMMHYALHSKFNWAQHGVVWVQHDEVCDSILVCGHDYYYCRGHSSLYPTSSSHAHSAASKCGCLKFTMARPAAPICGHTWGQACLSGMPISAGYTCHPCLLLPLPLLLSIMPCRPFLLLPPPAQPLPLLSTFGCCLLDPIVDVLQLSTACRCHRWRVQGVAEHEIKVVRSLVVEAQQSPHELSISLGYMLSWQPIVKASSAFLYMF